MSESPNINWPRKGDSAFALNGHPADPALLAAFVLPSPGAYAVGFKWAADNVIEAAEHDNRNPDFLFFPVAYLYRHYLELTLKGIVGMGVKSGSVSVTDERMTEHNLHKLWNKVRELIEAVWPDGSRVDTNAVEKVILEFHNMDESGAAFRYATDKAGNPKLAGAPQCVSLQNLKKTMDAVARYLNAADAGIDACDPGSPL